MPDASSRRAYTAAICLYDDRIAMLLRLTQQRMIPSPMPGRFSSAVSIVDGEHGKPNGRYEVNGKWMRTLGSAAVASGCFQRAKGGTFYRDHWIPGSRC
jgi:hypothetical protein